MKLHDEPQLGLQVRPVFLSCDVTEQVLMPHPRGQEDVSLVRPRLLILRGRNK